MTTTETVAAEQSAQAGVAALTQRVVAAWAYQDAEAFASVFTDDATMILAGTHCTGRDQIAAHMAAAFEGQYRSTQVTGKPLGLRLLAPDVALLITAGGVIEAGRTEVTPQSAIRASWLAVLRDGEWRLAAYQNTPQN